jgi:hypothetical protein
MANHDCNDDSNACNVQFSVDTNSAECIANRQYSRGDTLTIFYGRRSNADHLLHNGFVPTTNAYDYYKLKLGKNGWKYSFCSRLHSSSGD